MELTSVDCDRQKLTNSLKNREEQIRKLEDMKKNLEDEQHRLQRTARELSEDFKVRLPEMGKQRNFSYHPNDLKMPIRREFA